MTKKSFRQALNEGMRQEMERDPTVIVMGEDIAGGMGSKGEQDAWGDVLGAARGCYRGSDAIACTIRRSARAHSLVPPQEQRSTACDLLRS